MMVYVNSKKFACESCIKGHRSSQCHHTDRPLFEVKKKGRPVSQCDKCRELRHSRKMHSKCNCDKQATPPMQPLSSSAKIKRYIPIVPTLPNGLKDVIASSSVTKPADKRQLVHSLLNPCNCKSLWQCKCFCGSTSSRERSQDQSTYVPILPPILASETPITTNCVPTFPLMPPISTIASLAGSGCTCGVECSCPGCEEHRGPDHVDRSRKDCASGCGTCVDNQSGIALPGYESKSAASMIDQFLLRAAALPAPPLSRKIGSGPDLDPMNVTTYPRLVRETREHATAFGLIDLPKLECCGGKCGCTAGSCQCGKSCDGCCVERIEPPAVRSCCANTTRA